MAAILAEKTRVYIAKRLEKENKPIIDKAIEQAKAGDRYARDFLYERAHGKVAQPLTGPDDGPIKVEGIVVSFKER